MPAMGISPGALAGNARASAGIAEPSAVPGGIGDIDSLLTALRTGQLSAETLLPILMLLASGGGAGPGMGPGGPGGGMPAGPPMPGGGGDMDPIMAALSGMS